MTNKILRAYGWAAVSSQEQAKDEKQSIPSQIEAIQAAARQHGWQLMDILTVPGFSRNYHQFSVFKEECLRQGYDAPAKLEKLWQAHEIDVFVCRDGDRFGRTAGLLNAIMGELIDSGAIIYFTARNLVIDSKNAPTIGAISGLQTADEIARLVARYQSGMDGRVFNRGLPTHHNATHKIFTEGLGKDRREYVIVDEDQRRFFDDLRDLLLSGLGYRELVRELKRRGHKTRRGGYYCDSHIRKLLYSPITWGHLARHFSHLRGPWAYDPSLPAPEGVEVERSVIPPVWAGSDAERVKAELRRRESLRGRASPIKSHKFSGLLLCANCGYTMVSKFAQNRKPCYVCTSRQFRRSDDCHAPQIREDVAEEQIMQYLIELMLTGRDVSTFNRAGNADDHGYKLDRLQRSIEAAESRLEKLGLQRLDAAESAQGMYIKLINDQAASLEALKDEYRRLTSLIEPASHKEARASALSELAGLRIEEDLFSRSDREINQFLHRLMTGYQFLVKSGYIDGVAPRVKRIPRNKH